MKYVYLCGPITGQLRDDANDWRHEVSTHIHRASNGRIRCVSPLRCEPKVGSGEVYKSEYDDARFGTPQAIAAKNWFDVRNCDLLLAYMPEWLQEYAEYPSYGSLLEIGAAVALKKPVVAVSHDPYFYQCALVKGSVPWVFSTFEDAYDVILGVLEVYA